MIPPLLNATIFDEDAWGALSHECHRILSLQPCGSFCILHVGFRLAWRNLFGQGLDRNTSPAYQNPARNIWEHYLLPLLVQVRCRTHINSYIETILDQVRRPHVAQVMWAHFVVYHVGSG